MNDFGLTSTTRAPAIRPSTTSQPPLWALNRPPIRSASRSAHHEAGVVPGAGVAGPGVAEPDHQPGFVHAQNTQTTPRSALGRASSSASASAGSSSTSVGGRGQHVDDDGLRVGHQRDAGGQRDRAGQDLGALREALDRDLEGRRDVGGLGLDREAGEHVLEQAAGGDLAGGEHRDVHGDLLAAAHEQQVDVLEGAAHRVLLHGLRDGQLALAAEVQVQQDVRGLEREEQGVLRQGEVDDLLLVPVEHGRGSCRRGAAGEPRPCRSSRAPRRLS